MINQKPITECSFFSARQGGFELDLFQYDNDDTDDDTLVRNSIRIACLSNVTQLLFYLFSPSFIWNMCIPKMQPNAIPTNISELVVRTFIFQIHESISSLQLKYITNFCEVVGKKKEGQWQKHCEKSQW